MQRAVLVVLAAGALAGCATDVKDTGGAPSPSLPASVSSPSTSTNPCLGESGPTKAPDYEPDTEQYLGLIEQEASDLASDNGFTLRLARRDGRCYALTMDYRLDRVNVYLEDTVVTAASIG